MKSTNLNNTSQGRPAQCSLDLTLRGTYGDAYVDDKLIDTSSAKFDEMDTQMPEMQNHIISVMRQWKYGLTPVDVMNILAKKGVHKAITSIRPPMTILLKHGVLVDTGQRRDKQYVLKLRLGWENVPLPKKKARKRITHKKKNGMAISLAKKIEAILADSTEAEDVSIPTRQAFESIYGDPRAEDYEGVE